MECDYYFIPFHTFSSLKVSVLKSFQCRLNGFVEPFKHLAANNEASTINYLHPNWKTTAILGDILRLRATTATPR